MPYPQGGFVDVGNGERNLLVCPGPPYLRDEAFSAVGDVAKGAAGLLSGIFANGAPTEDNNGDYCEMLVEDGTRWQRVDGPKESDACGASSRKSWS